MSIYDDILGRESGLTRPAILGQDSLSHGELLFLVEGAATILKSAGATEGDRVACDLPHGLDSIVVHLAVQSLLLVLVPVNPRAKDDEKVHAVRNAACRFIVSSMTGSSWLQVFGAEASFRQRVDRWVVTEILNVPAMEIADRASLIIHTSGSTGKPKGVVLSTSAVSANVVAVAEYLALAPVDRTIVFTPPHYSFAVSQILTHLWVGGAVLPWEKGLFDVIGMLHAAADANITGLAANPGFLGVITNALADEVIAFPAMRYVMTVGQPLTSKLAHKVVACLPTARVVNMYGCTENSPRVSFKWLPTDIPERETAWPVGRAVRGSEIAILDENGDHVAQGTMGEVSIKGSSLLSEYAGDPEMMSNRMSGGFFRTRDLGYFDEEGDLNVVGRLDNIILVGHEKVSPEEIEDVTLRIAGVHDVAVGALPNEMLFEVPAMLVVLNQPFQDSEVAVEEVLQRIKTKLAQSLSRSKVPRHIYTVKAIPRTEYGKIDRPGVRRVLVALDEEKTPFVIRAASVFLKNVRVIADNPGGESAPASCFLFSELQPWRSFHCDTSVTAVKSIRFRRSEQK